MIQASQRSEAMSRGISAVLSSFQPHQIQYYLKHSNIAILLHIDNPETLVSYLTDSLNRHNSVRTLLLTLQFMIHPNLIPAITSALEPFLDPNDMVPTSNTHCYCENRLEVSDNKVVCVRCRKSRHQECLLDVKRQATRCLECVLRHVDPLAEVKEVVGLKMIMPKERILRWEVNLSHVSVFERVVIRCIKAYAGSTLRGDQQWPRGCSVIINGLRFMDLSTKDPERTKDSRKESPFVEIPPTLFIKKVEVEVRVYPSTRMDVENEEQDEHAERNPTGESEKKCSYLLGLLVIKDKTPQQVISKSLSTMGDIHTYTCAIMKKFQMKGSETQKGSGSSERVSLICPITESRIKIPARGLYCKHLPCFDLVEYLAMSSVNRPGLMRCPFAYCKEACEEFIVDPILNKAIEDDPRERVRFVQFSANGYTYINNSVGQVDTGEDNCRQDVIIIKSQSEDGQEEPLHMDPQTTIERTINKLQEPASRINKPSPFILVRRRGGEEEIQGGKQPRNLAFKSTNQLRLERNYLDSHPPKVKPLHYMILELISNKLLPSLTP